MGCHSNTVELLLYGRGMRPSTETKLLMLRFSSAQTDIARHHTVSVVQHRPGYHVIGLCPLYSPAPKTSPPEVRI